jgi:ADP-ribosylglycohydrolase
LPSDDTQLAFWTLEQMIADGGFVPENVARRFCQEPIFGIGSTVRRFISNFKAGKPWYECGPESAGNGALMRIAPMVTPHLATGTGKLWVDTALSAMMTHNDAGSISSCLAFVYMLRQLMVMEIAPEAKWWPDTYVQIARPLEGETRYRPRGGLLRGEFEGPIWKMVQNKVTEAYTRSLPVKDACSWWYSGAFLLETVPSAIYILMRHGHDPEEAIVRAVNDTKDNDTTAAIVGAAVGALHGVEKIPGRWVKGLSGRTTDRDDRKVFRLLSTAREKFWPTDR